MKTLPHYDGKVCVVTGAASGIGRAVARKLAASGATLALSDIDEHGLTETVEMIGGANRHKVDRLDMADADAIAAYAPAVQAALGPADYVFNIAGLTRVGDFRNTPAASYEKIMDVNFYGVVRMSKAFLEQLIETRGGLVNVSSIFGIVGWPGQAHYCASKFGVRGFSESLSMEMEEHGVSVTCVHPGGVKTNVARNAQVDHIGDPGVTKAMMDENFDKHTPTSAERAAEIILDGAARRKPRIIVGPDARFMQFWNRLFPTRYRKLVRKRARSLTDG
ncbi:SDR family NAD(P)-dependent oxidoreductase [uncultured Algimonas sp.]|uniref:SDR family NAD(P)-dependent oxidoreductase n=1 Tax=uncultured Algimonas sp. TaxID=1547920 RepID=UPI00262F72B7|nr:SDR family NAD(P)-dependent oxidoreductase [uncultured Algimonas sp.]